MSNARWQIDYAETVLRAMEAVGRMQRARDDAIATRAASCELAAWTAEVLQVACHGGKMPETPPDR
jgi:hypothetical protein